MKCVRYYSNSRSHLHRGIPDWWIHSRRAQALHCLAKGPKKEEGGSPADYCRCGWQWDGGGGSGWAGGSSGRSATFEAHTEGGLILAFGHNSCYSLHHEALHFLWSLSRDQGKNFRAFYWFILGSIIGIYSCCWQVLSKSYYPEERCLIDINDIDEGCQSLHWVVFGATYVAS